MPRATTHLAIHTPLLLSLRLPPQPNSSVDHPLLFTPTPNAALPEAGVASPLTGRASPASGRGKRHCRMLKDLAGTQDGRHVVLVCSDGMLLYHRHTQVQQ